MVHDVEDDPIVPNVSTNSFGALVERNNAHQNQISVTAKGQADRVP